MRKTLLGCCSLAALAATLSAQSIIYTFDADAQGWSATTWDGNGSQTAVWESGQLVGSYGASGYHWMTNIWTNSGPLYDLFDAAFANPSGSSISFDVTVDAGTAAGAGYFQIITALQGGGNGAFESGIVGSFDSGALSAGATQTITQDFAFGDGTTANQPGADNYQFIIGVNSDWTGGSIRIDNVELTAVAAVPEPNTLGAGALAWALRRRR